VTDEPERRRSADEVLAVLQHRLDAIEKHQEQAAKEQSRGFEQVRHQIAGLTFVRLDVYDADQRTAHQIHVELGKDIDGISTQVKLLWSVVGATVIAGLIGVLFQIASRS
jgi:hypothetical protein